MRRMLRATTRAERAVVVAALVGYVVLALVLWGGKDFSGDGPLSFDRRAAGTEELASLGTSQARVERDCFEEGDRYGDYVKIVTAEIGGRRLFACYDADRDGAVQGVRVVDGEGTRVRNPAVLKPAGVWPHYAVVKSGEELVLGGIGLVVLMGFGFYVATRPRAEPAPDGTPWWGRNLTMGLLASLIVVGWIVIAALPRVARARKARFVMWGVIGWAVLFGFTLVSDALDRNDPWGTAVVSYLAAGTVAGFGLGVRARPRLPAMPRPRPTAPPAPAPAEAPPAPPAQAQAGNAQPAEDLARIQRPESLPNFASVGGLAAVKAELRETVGLVLAFTEHADAYRVSWNGVLLHGRPGTGKTFLVQAMAGEFGLNLVHVTTGDLVSAYRGESARNVAAVFDLAVRNIPAVLFFDEFDSIALRRDDNPDQEARRTVNQLLQSLESTRSIRELIVMAATNDINSLDPAVIRPGRFDRHIHIPLPDLDARASIFRAQLRGRPGGDDIDVDELARRTEGLTPAALAQVVSAAAIAAMRESASDPSGRLVPLTTERLVHAVKTRGGRDRPTVEAWSWGRLILPARIKAELQEVAALVADPERAARFGVEPPSGILLHGPPGTGKTTIARVLAAESDCSFYSVSAAELTSKWLGESERLISQLFDRARDNRPSIVFIDEIDAVAGVRGEWGTYDRQVNQLLQEIDGVESTPGVIVIGATNRKDILDPALLRGGRLSRHIEIPLPDLAGRRAMLGMFTESMPLRGVDVDELARRTEGLSGADLEALCQEAAMQAIIREGDAPDPGVTADDFAAALAGRLGTTAPTAAEAGPRKDTEGYI